MLTGVVAKQIDEDVWEVILEGQGRVLLGTFEGKEAENMAIVLANLIAKVGEMDVVSIDRRWILCP